MLRQRVARIIMNRIGAASTSSAVAAASRLAHDDLTAVFAPLISSAGVDALWSRAFDLTQREFFPDERREAHDVNDSPFGRVTSWVECQQPSVAAEAVAAMFSTFAELLTALIGEPMTTRYLVKAWPDGFSDDPSKEKSHE